MSEATSDLLVVTGVVKRFGGFTALDGVDLNLKAGERLGLLGPNGSGKSTLVNCICGTLFNDAGSVKFEGHEVSRMAAHKRIRRGLARSFQLPKPFGTMTVVENLCVPILYAANARHGAVHATPAMAREQAMEILKKMGLAAKANEMSSGLTQVDMRKLELARAMASQPKLLISDEAMAGLSNSEVDEIIDLLFTLKEQGIAVIMIEHIMRAVMRFSERVAVLVAGKKIADGDPQDVMRNPEVERAYLGE
ncbi:MAG TPA: ABC transporter ATP-binding protein [Burkholderiales bacterium]|jgi:branched-chain amino acid transport system ATP-binding protein